MPIIRMNAEFARVHSATRAWPFIAHTGLLETLALAKKLATEKPPVNRVWNT